VRYNNARFSRETVMFKNPMNAERGDSQQGVVAQRLAPSTSFFEAKIPENAFSASKSRPFSGHFAAAQTENAERFCTGSA